MVKLSMHYNRPCAKILFITGLFIAIQSVLADVRLNKIFSDHMVLQRGIEVKVWGQAAQDEKITVSINNQTVSTSAREDGKWEVSLAPMTAGGPYEMQITGKNSLSLQDILIGDVWICSGQSNMQWPVSRVQNAEDEIAAADHPNIRLYTVKRTLSATPRQELPEGEWQICLPASVPEFSAVGYFFGRSLEEELKVPLGLISSNWGGTVCETWTSREAIENFPEFEDKLAELEKTNVEKLYDERDKNRKEWQQKIDANDLGMKEKWYLSPSVPADWQKMTLPQHWEDAGLEDLDGVVWFMNEVMLTPEQAAQSIFLHLGPIDNTDLTYINGTLIGSLVGRADKKREYLVEPKVLKPGKNVISVRVTDYGGTGGIWGKPEELYYQTGENTNISLAGQWAYKIGLNELPKLELVGPNSYPTLLYNAMINPLIRFAIKGAIWYQGESNAGRAYQYRALFPAMITDWRKHWDQGDFPFLWVQLANFMQPKEEPTESAWAELREAQLRTLSLPNTGMAVIIDIGEADNIHPKNKQDVGYRLARHALKTAYQQDIVYSGPLYKSFKIEDAKIRIDFTNTGSGLTAKDRYGYLKGFAIAGEDKKFVWARAWIEDNTIVVYNEAIKHPLAVRYAWADNPDDANLYNKEGMPASPFRTDDWPGVTEGKK